jgi:lysozyme family protein
VVLAHEGGYVNHPQDPGGPTNWGISLLMVEREGITAKQLGIPDLSPESFRKMPQSAAIAMYRLYFWDRYHYDQIQVQEMATKLFDAAVNIGPARAHRLGQYAANICGKHLLADGILGPVTFAALNTVLPFDWMKAMAEELRFYYQSLITRKPSLMVFANNWLQRAAWGVMTMTGNSGGLSGRS